MMRTTKVLSITLPAPMLEEARELARRENRTMSELVREALRSYQSQRENQKRWERIRALGKASAEQAGVFDEQDVVRVVREFRKQDVDSKLDPA